MIASLFRSSEHPTGGDPRGWSPFDRLHLLLPLLAVLLGLLLEYTDLDLRLEALFYNGQSWPWREHWLTQGVLHEGGRFFMNLIGLGLLVAIVASFATSRLGSYRKVLVCLFFAMAVGPLVVGYFKSVSHIYSPWDLAYFGGGQEYVKLFDEVPRGAPVGHAFPAGHASGGFAVTVTYFALAITYPRWRFWGLGIGLVLGFLFGFAQQMRGAHFLSHDLFALAVCWCGGWLVFAAFYGSKWNQNIKPNFG